MFLIILTLYEYLLRADTSDPWYDIIWFSPFHVSAPRGPYPWVRGYVGPTHWQARAIIKVPVLYCPGTFWDFVYFAGYYG